MFGLVVRFTLKVGQGEAFDALARETLPLVRAEEPGTLVYTCHEVHDEPDARVFYELYRDRDAFDAHERTNHVVRFLREREQHLAAEPRVEFLDLQDGKGVPDLG